MSGGSEPGRRFCAHLAKAVAAVYRPVASWAEGHHGVVAALGTVDREHLSRPILVHACRSLFGTPHCSTATAALRFVPEPSGLEKFLLTRGKYEFPATLHAIKSSV